MSALGGKADVNQRPSERPLIAKSGSSVGQGEHEISATRWLRKTPSSHCRGTCLGLLQVGACRGKLAKMNRANKRRQQKLAKKATSNAKLGKATAKLGKATNRSPGQQTLANQESLDLATQHHAAGRLPEAESIYQQILQADAVTFPRSQPFGPGLHQILIGAQVGVACWNGLRRGGE